MTKTIPEQQRNQIIHIFAAENRKRMTGMLLKKQLMSLRKYLYLYQGYNGYETLRFRQNHRAQGLWSNKD